MNNDEKSIFDIEPLYSNNDTTNYLLYNINLLQNYPITHYNYLLYEVDTQKNLNMLILSEKSKLEQEKTKIEQEKKDLLLETSRLKRKIIHLEDELYFDKNPEKKIKISKYEYYKFNTTKKSYDNEKINEILCNIKSIDDIINLKEKWYNIRHNKELQKLYNTIPALEKLNSLVGMNKLKKDLFRKLIYFVKNEHTDEYLHTVICGPPGVGKTEFAKIYADIFVRLNVLSSDTFIEIKRDDLVGKYLGQTAPKTRELLDKALGGVIFLDEAYSLGNEEKRDSFSKEAIDMINQYLSEHKHELMFIIAGYEEDIDKCFFSYNRGLKRRFSTVYTIENYDYKELLEIFKMKVKQYKYNLCVEEDKIEKFFKENKDIFINQGGDIERLFNEIKYNQCLRIFKENVKNVDIKLEDIENSVDIFKKKEDNKINFNMYL
jgi:SpoVK/Ycf46/Vps4 family AAA+-type ATPase